ncbi:hypothetical protein KFK09_021106 [Dendrobium nobile]|uniref:Uncharacterized protein n=1 Tax=Dendrobium nobile TaxID=94219 RepID=A0A8T3AP96_DENNO|nr:hypothetical protein KFK09_021106 [Dendrobium nobile]
MNFPPFVCLVNVLAMFRATVILARMISLMLSLSIPNSNVIPSSVENTVVPSLMVNAEQVLDGNDGKLEYYVVIFSPVVLPYVPLAHDLGSLVPVSTVLLPVQSLVSLVSVDEVVAIVSTVEVS